MHDDEVGDNESEGEMEIEGGGDGCHAPHKVGAEAKSSVWLVLSSSVVECMEKVILPLTVTKASTFCLQ